MKRSKVLEEYVVMKPVGEGALYLDATNPLTATPLCVSDSMFKAFKQRIAKFASRKAAERVQDAFARINHGRSSEGWTVVVL